jgi:nitroreductase
MTVITHPAPFPDTHAPAQGADYQSLLEDAVRLAILAPSAHNTQPWRFRIAGDAVDLFADRSRRLPVADPDDRELTISCGAALYHLECAIRHYGREAETTLLPTPHDPDLLARVRIGRRIDPPADGQGLVDVMPLRRTNRHRFAPDSVPADLVRTMLRSANANGVWAMTVEGPARHAVGELVEDAVQQQWEDPAFRKELAGWLRPASAGDGLPSLYLKGWGPFMVKSLNLGRRKSGQSRLTVESTPLFLAIGSETDEPRAWLETGRALAKLLLQARVGGIDAAYHNEPVQVTGTRSRLRGAIGATGVPQLLLRLGYGKEVPPSPRRPVSDVMV